MAAVVEEALVITEAMGCYSLLGIDVNPIKCTWNGSDLILNTVSALARLNGNPSIANVGHVGCCY